MRKVIIIDNLEDFKKILDDSIKQAVEKYFPDNNSKSSVSPQYLDLEEAALLLRLSRQTIYQNINRIPHYKQFGRLYFKEEELVQYIENSKSK